MAVTKEKLKKLEDLFKMVNDSLTRTEFVESFKLVLKQVKKLEEDLMVKLDAKTQGTVKDLEEITSIHRETVSRIEKDNKAGLSNLKKFAIGKITDLFVKSDINKRVKIIDDRIEGKMREVEKRLANIHDGIDSDEEAMIERLKGMIPEIPTFEIPE